MVELVGFTVGRALVPFRPGRALHQLTFSDCVGCASASASHPALWSTCLVRLCVLHTACTSPTPPTSRPYCTTSKCCCTAKPPRHPGCQALCSACTPQTCAHRDIRSTCSFRSVEYFDVRLFVWLADNYYDEIRTLLSSPSSPPACVFVLCLARDISVRMFYAKCRCWVHLWCVLTKAYACACILLLSSLFFSKG